MVLIPKGVKREALDCVVTNAALCCNTVHSLLCNWCIQR